MKGKSVLKEEIENCKKIPEAHRVFYKNHTLGDEGEGEPHQSGQEIIIEEQYDAKYLY